MKWTIQDNSKLTFATRFPSVFQSKVTGSQLLTKVFSEKRSEPKATQNPFLDGNHSISVKFDNNLFLQNKTSMPDWSWQYRIKKCHSGYKQEMFRVLIQ